MDASEGLARARPVLERLQQLGRLLDAALEETNGRQARRRFRPVGEVRRSRGRQDLQDRLLALGPPSCRAEDRAVGEATVAVARPRSNPERCGEGLVDHANPTPRRAPRRRCARRRRAGRSSSCRRRRSCAPHRRRARSWPRRARRSPQWSDPARRGRSPGRRGRAPRARRPRTPTPARAPSSPFARGTPPRRRRRSERAPRSPAPGTARPAREVAGRARSSLGRRGGCRSPRCEGRRGRRQRAPLSSLRQPLSTL